MHGMLIIEHSNTLQCRGICGNEDMLITYVLKCFISNCNEYFIQKILFSAINIYIYEIN